MAEHVPFLRNPCEFCKSRGYCASESGLEFASLFCDVAEEKVRRNAR